MFIHLIIEKQFSFISSKIFSKNKLKMNYNFELKGIMNISINDLINLLKAYNNTQNPIQLCNNYNLKYEHFYV